MGCSTPSLDPLDADSTILAFGDSLTLGYRVNIADSYPAVLSELTGIEVVNSGVSGETTEEGLARLGGELDKHNPDLLILMEGGNDILQNLDPKLTKRNLSAMIDLANKRDIAVVLVGYPEKKLFSDVAPIYEELARENSVVFEGELVGRLLRQSEYKLDPIHLNEKGYRKMAESFRNLLEENGAI